MKWAFFLLLFRSYIYIYIFPLYIAFFFCLGNERAYEINARNNSTAYIMWLSRRLLIIRL
jgi:hypothetical protein